MIVSANGAGNVIVITGVVAGADSVTVPFASAMLGTSGEVAVAVPILQPVPAGQARDVGADVGRDRLAQSRA